MSYGTALITDVEPKTLQHYEQPSLETLAADSANINVPHETVISLALKKEAQKPRKFDSFVRLTMRMQKEGFQVYEFEMKYRQSPNSEAMVRFYMVPLGAYFKPRRQTQSRETILREYANERSRFSKGLFQRKPYPRSSIIHTTGCS